MKFDKYRQSLALIGARQPRGRERGRGPQSSRVAQSFSRQSGESLLATGCGVSQEPGSLEDTAAQWNRFYKN